MKKLIIAVCTALMLGCSSGTHQELNPTSVKEQLTITNPLEMKTKTLDMDYEWLEDPSPAFIQISMEESLRFFDEKGTGIILYSYETCPWCNRAVPVLNEAAKARGVTLYYVDVYEPELFDENHQFSAYGNEMVQKMMSKMDSILKHELNPDTGKEEPAFYTPEVVAVKDGKIVDHHAALVDGFVMVDGTERLTEEQAAELRNIYDKMIQEVAD